MAVSLSDLVRVKMEEEGLSLRDAGDEAGVAHTTIDRVKRGDSVDLKTVEKICEWIGVPVPAVLGIKSEDEAQKSDIASLIALHPELGEVLSELAKEITKNNLDPTILAEITGFTSYRMQMYKEKRRRKQENK